MDCTAVCASTSFKIKPLFDWLKSSHKTEMIREVIYADIPVNDKIVHTFFFPYGSIVGWGANREELQSIVSMTREFEVSPVEEVEFDEFSYDYGEKQLRIVEDLISLNDVSTLLMLALSHAIAQSVKLGSFEIKMQKTFNSTQQLPEDLAKKGRIGLSRKQISQKMGSLFLDRNSINLYLDVLDTPDFFWEYPELETAYHLMANYLDIKSRVDVLNQRLGVIHELFEMLATELNHQHSSRLEWTIILLIVIEVIVSVLRDVLKII